MIIGAVDLIGVRFLQEIKNIEKVAGLAAKAAKLNICFRSNIDYC